MCTDKDPEEALYSALTNSVRRLVDVTIRSRADQATIVAVRAKVDEAADELGHVLMPQSFGLQETTDGRAVVWGNAVIGLRNALAPPLVVQHDADGVVWAETRLGAAYEGPAGHVHGGICALLLDHVLGATAHRPGRPAVTGTLTTRYEKGTRLGPLRVQAHVDRIAGVKTFAVGHIETADGITVRAEGIFIHPRNPTK